MVSAKAGEGMYELGPGRAATQALDTFPTGESGEQDAHLDWDVELANLHWWLLFQLPAVHFAV